MNKLTSFLFLIFITSCGFSPIYLSNENSIIQSVKKIELNGNESLGENIKNILNIETNKNNKFLIIFNSSVEKISISKNSSSATTSFMMIMDVGISVIDNNEILLEKSFNKNFTYNNRDNKFELLEYERSIEENLISEISDEILLYLSLNNDSQRFSN